MAFDIAKSTSTLEAILKDNIVAYWSPAALDTEYGGYRSITENVDQARSQSKPVIAQARMLWFFSHLINCGCADKSHVEAAHNGFGFLRDKMWDSDHGGFYWEVDRSGGRVLVDLKHIYAQAFALVALSEYAIALNNPVATSLAGELFGCLERHAHDGASGGYQEFFTREWIVISQADSTPTSKNWLLSTSYRHPTRKSFNTHLHLLEAVTNYYRLSPDARVRDRLYELVLITSNSVNAKDGNGCIDFYDRDWRPQSGRDGDRVTYGHDMENVTLLTKALDALELPQKLLMEFYRSSFNNALHYGFDDSQGGFFHSGSRGKPADRRSKYAWIQGEGLLSALQMFSHFGDAIYARCFAQTLDWITNSQVDWVNGEWHCEILPDGTVDQGQIESWHSPYHNGRAVLQSLTLLKDLPEKMG